MKLKEVVIARLHVLLFGQATDLSRGPKIDPADAGIESPHAAESRGQGNLIHWQTRLVDQLLREVQTARLSHRNRRRAQMLQEQTSKMPRPDAQPLRQNFDSTVLQPTLTDQA